MFTLHQRPPTSVAMAIGTRCWREPWGHLHREDLEMGAILAYTVTFSVFATVSLEQKTAWPLLLLLVSALISVNVCGVSTRQMASYDTPPIWAGRYGARGWILLAGMQLLIGAPMAWALGVNHAFAADRSWWVVPIAIDGGLAAAYAGLRAAPRLRDTLGYAPPAPRLSVQSMASPLAWVVVCERMRLQSIEAAKAALHKNDWQLALRIVGNMPFDDWRDGSGVHLMELAMGKPWPPWENAATRARRLLQAQPRLRMTSPGPPAPRQDAAPPAGFPH